MKKVKNFKVYFNNFLDKNYEITEEEKKLFWEHRSEIEAVKNDKKGLIIPAMTVTGVGLAGIMVGTFNPVGLNTYAQNVCITASSITALSGASFTVGTFIGKAIVKHNLHEDYEINFKQLDKDYKKELKKYKKNNK